MKKLLLPSAMLGLTVLLTACPGQTPPTSTAHTLTVKVEGIASAPVIVTNTTTNTQIFSGAVEGSKTFGDLKAGDVFRVEGRAVNGYTAPAAQTVTLNGDRAVTLPYTQATPAGSAVSADRIAGRITGSPFKLSSVVLDTSADPFFGVAEVDAAGNFALDLGGLTPPAGHSYALTEGCTATGANTNPNVQVYSNSILDAYGSQGDRVGIVVERIVSGTGKLTAKTRVTHVYASADATFKGTCTFSDGTIMVKEDYDVTLKAGWNALALTEDGQTFTYRNVGSDTRAELQFLQLEPHVAAYLDPETLTFTGDGAVTVDAAFVQVGGYSGAVKLRTDDPNLTVTPDTLTLPALSAQSVRSQTKNPRLAELKLGAQLVQQKLTFRYTGTDNVSRPFELQVLDAGGQVVGGGYGLLNVQRPGIFVSTATPGLQVTPNSSVGLSVYLTSVSGFSGNVNVRLEGLPAGVNANSVTVALGSNSGAIADLTVTGRANLTPGEYEATLIAEGNGRSARSTVKIVIPKPSVNVSVVNAYEPVTGYQGETGNVRINVVSNFGFSGSTTLTLTGLPAGVTAAPVTVQLAANATTTVDIPLTVAENAALGDSTVRVTSPDGANMGSADTFTLTVRPARTLLAGFVSGLAPAQTGVWVLTTQERDASSGSYSSALRRYMNGQAVATVSVNGVDSKLLSLPSGDVLVLSGYDGKEVVQVNDTGTTTPVAAPADLRGGAADRQGRIWFVRMTSVGIGGHQTTLERWDPATNTTTVVDDSRDYGYNSGQFIASNDGAFLAYLPSYSNKAVRIGTSTGTLTDLTLFSSTQGNAALSNAGQLWYSSYGRLVRLNADGTSTTFQNIAATALIGFDVVHPQILWTVSYNGVLKIDTSSESLSVTTFATSTGGMSRGTPLRDGGVAVTQTESTYEQSRSSLTIIR